tara:strand:- start:41 stop:328 length:288 start_codon:yes stop_codon:yes gene_type:complete
MIGKSESLPIKIPTRGLLKICSPQYKAFSLLVEAFALYRWRTFVLLRASYYLNESQLIAIFSGRINLYAFFDDEAEAGLTLLHKRSENPGRKYNS